MAGLDPQIWMAIAGSAARVPSAGSLVYYFPQGHADQALSPPSLPSHRPFSLCRVASVSLLANPDSDEVFARLLLDPNPSSSSSPPPPPDGTSTDSGAAVAFAKILTPSDANNGGGFSVPRFCADSIFPPLNFRADPPVQTLSIKDVHGASFDFRHIFRGTPRRHLLTTGWSKFVNSKKLVAGDSVVFIKKPSSELFVGVRRTGRSGGGGGGGEFLIEQGLGFSRNGRGRVAAESVEEAVRLCEMGREFEVVYYPRAGSAEFVVGMEVVEAAMGVKWSGGMRVKMAVETEDSSRLTWLEGTVAGAELADSGRWPRSPWRMLQVTWDEPEVCQSVRMVSPWQVELVCDSPHMQSLFPAMKKLKVPLPHCLELSGERQGCIPFPMAGFKSTKMESLTSSLFNYNTFPAGMQGARHDFCVPSLSNFVPRKTQNMFSDNPHGINMPRKSNILQSEGMSPLSEKCVRNHGMGILDGPTCNSTRKVRKGSFQLFGQIIHMEQPNDAIDKDYVENEGGVRSLDFSLAYPHKQYLDSIDIQRQRAVEACSL